MTAMAVPTPDRALYYAASFIYDYALSPIRSAYGKVISINRSRSGFRVRFEVPSTTAAVSARGGRPGADQILKVLSRRRFRVGRKVVLSGILDTQLRAFRTVTAIHLLSTAGCGTRRKCPSGQIIS